MWTKIQSLFGKQNPQKDVNLGQGFDHSKVTGADASQCPFMQKKSKENQQNPQKCPVTGKNAGKEQADSDSQEQAPKGGCPFMNSTSEKKKNPNLMLEEAGYNEPFISKFKFYLSGSKIDFAAIQREGPPEPMRRQIFNSYPIYLKHTIFYNGEDFKKVRTLECCSRFMAYQQLREKGNKRYNQGKFYEALDYYQRAMSLFRWLQYYEPLNESSTNMSEHGIASEKNSQLGSENGSRVNLALDQTEESDPKGVFDELKSKYKEFFITYGDDNTRLNDGEDMHQTADIDMRKSLLIQIYLNMCAAFIKTHHYDLAVQICNDGLALSQKVSQLYFRKAQALTLRKDATVADLELAQKSITTAIQNRSQEKIFATANINILKMLNIHNSEQAYEACKQNVEKKLGQVRAENARVYQKIFNRAKQIHEIELRMISEGKTPVQFEHSKLMKDTVEMKILDRMELKYVKVIEFYTEAKNPEQVNLAKQELQEVLKIKHQVSKLFNVVLDEKANELGGVSTDKIQKRIAFVKTNYAEVIYNAGKFNFTMLEWVIKEIVKEEAEEKKKEEKKLAEQKAQEDKQNGKIAPKRGISYYLVYLLVLIPLLCMAVNMYML